MLPAATPAKDPAEAPESENARGQASGEASGVWRHGHLDRRIFQLVGAITRVGPEAPGVVAPSLMIDDEEALPADRRIVLERRAALRTGRCHASIVRRSLAVDTDP